MMTARCLFYVLLACANAPAAFAQAVGPYGVVIPGNANPSVPPNLVVPNAVPGGITLVPGTVVIPAVGGSMTTGTVPLAGTVGSAGVGTFNPGLGLNPTIFGGALYPPAVYPQIALPATNQSAVPQTDPTANVAPYGPQPWVANCPTGVSSANASC